MWLGLPPFFLDIAIAQWRVSLQLRCIFFRHLSFQCTFGKHLYLSYPSLLHAYFLSSASCQYISLRVSCARTSSLKVTRSPTVTYVFCLVEISKSFLLQHNIRISIPF